MKILIVMKNWLGDTIFQLPALEWIHNQYPDAEIVCLAPERCRQVLDANPYVSRLISFDEKTTHRSWFRWVQLVFMLRKETWAQAYLFHRSRSRALLTWFAGAKERIGYGAKRSWFLTQAVAEPEKPMHQVDYFIHLLRQVGLKKSGDIRYKFYTRPAEEEEAEVIIQKYKLKKGSFVCFHLGANWKPKRWPETHFSKLADLIHARGNFPVVITGGSDDGPLAERMIAQVRDALVISTVGQMSLGALGALFRQSALVVSADSGPMHIASGVGARVVALFGPTDPKLTGPRGTGESLILQYLPEGYPIPWYGKNFPDGGWLSKIEPEEVISAVDEKGWLTAAQDSEIFGKTLTQPSHWPLTSNSPIRARNILVVTLSNIGDVILTTPVITALTKEFPDAKMTVVVGPKAEGLLRGSRRVHRLVIYDKRAGLWKQWQFLRRLHGVTYDIVVDLRNTAIPFLVRSRKKSPIRRPFKQKAMRARHLEILEWMGLSRHAGNGFDFYDSQDERRLMDKWTVSRGSPILVAAGAASETKRWDLRGFSEVILRLLGICDQNILLVGDLSEADHVQGLVRVNPSRVHNLAGKTTLRELASLVARCSLLLSNDSAIMHLGHELHRPVVALFGPTDPEKYGRVGDYFRVIQDNDFNHNMAEKVFQECEGLLVSNRSQNINFSEEAAFSK